MSKESTHLFEYLLYRYGPSELSRRRPKLLHAAPQQNGITDNFVKTELSPLPGPKWQ